MDATEQQERLEVIAYHALWQLRDLDPDAEPGYFRRTRLDLHDRLDPDAAPATQDAPDRHLHLVG